MWRRSECKCRRLSFTSWIWLSSLPHTAWVLEPNFRTGIGLSPSLESHRVRDIERVWEYLQVPTLALLFWGFVW